MPNEVPSETVIARCNEIMRLCHDPKTIQELADITKVHHHTVRKYVGILKEKGQLVEATWRQGKAPQYMAITGGEETDKIQVIFRNQRVSIDNFIGTLRMPTNQDVLERIGNAYCALWWNQFCRDNKGFETSVEDIDIAIDLVYYRDLLRDFAEAIDMTLQADFWKKSNFYKRAFDYSDAEQLQKLDAAANTYEHEWQEKGEARKKQVAESKSK